MHFLDDDAGVENVRFWDKENSPDWRFLRAKRVLGRASEKKRRDGEFYYSKTGGSERIRTSGTVARTHAFQA